MRADPRTPRLGVCRVPPGARRATISAHGRIPFSAIEAIDWDGDEYYGFTHIYCRFRAFSRGPYEERVLYDVQERDLGRGHTYHERLDGVRWNPKRRTIVARWRERPMLRKTDRDAAR